MQTLKLRSFLTKATDHIKKKIEADKQNLYDILTKNSEVHTQKQNKRLQHEHQKTPNQSKTSSYLKPVKKNEQKKQIEIQNQEQMPQKLTSERSRINTKSRSRLKQKSSSRIKSVNSEQTPSKKKQRYFDEPQQEIQAHLLIQKRQKLLSQLQHINIQLKVQKIVKYEIQQEKSAQKEKYEEEMTKKAHELIKKMNRQRQELIKRKDKSERRISQNINKSIEMYQEALIEQEKMKELNRQQIQIRIEERKRKVLQRNAFSRHSNSLVKEIKSFQTQKSDRSLKKAKQSGHINPQRYKSHQTQSSQKSLAQLHKQYQISPFLQKIFQEENRKKREIYFKQIEKKRVAIKHKQYADKMRTKAKSYGDSSMFIT